ncbi:non-ribosomal peptide synthetase [Chitinophaga rhizophila]|uniref:Amino acid adenylation domain-containing protein n=1 Tax=Chitinophaga rhizophila TaxID=2866212 RepID=A0ABS7G6Z0_9BACT|nr:non-ribosomal peptide synthetase [Chitinophaga rhizophila]MBW8683055.1 amino acid adenylation domain-containing protein [Chitinophaga rhizophila]
MMTSITSSPANNTASIVTLFREQAALHAIRTAICDDKGELTYQELDDYSDRIAARLLEAQVSQGQLICICMPRSAMLVTGILGILKANAAYVPIDPSYPVERIRFILEDTGTPIIVTGSQVPANLSLAIADSPVELVQIQPDLLPSAVKKLVHTAPDAATLAYVMYTSGTTGKPKGVMIRHGNVVNLVSNIDYVRLDKDSRLLSTGSPAFDASTFEYWGMLLNGGLLVLSNEDKLLDPVRMKMTIRQHNINTMWLTSSWLNQLIDTDMGIFEGLEFVLAGGEKLSAHHIRLLLHEYPQLQVINGYGPTENTTFSLTYRIPSSSIPDNIPIGTALPGRTVYLLNTAGNSCTQGETGEIYVGGAGVGEGYLNQPALTDTRFSPDPFSNIPGSRMYRTGDLGQWLPDGNVVFLGRTDNQVKIRGFRIEPGEIEAVLLQSGLVQQVAVVCQHIDTRKYLTAYIVPADNYIQEKAVTILAGTLPEYMIPRAWMTLPSMPLTTNGKIDIRALPVPTAPTFNEDYIPPKNETEQQIAALWEQLLEISPVGTQQTFFELGGYSLMLIELYNKFSATFNANIPFDILFSDPTVEKMAQWLLEQKLTNNDHAGSDLAGFTTNGVTFTQRNFFIRNRLNPAESFPNSGIVYEITGMLDIVKLNLAFQQVIALNESLHTSYAIHGREVIHTVQAPEQSFSIQTIVAETSSIDTLVHQLTTPFNFGEAPLIRVFHIEMPDERQYLYVDMPHINSDGTSLNIIIREAANMYNGEKPEERKAQFSSFRQFLHRYLNSKQVEQDAFFWKEQFRQPVPLLQLPPRAGNYSGVQRQGTSMVVAFPSDLKTRLDNFLQGKKLTAFQLMVSTYTLLLHQLTANTDIAVMVPVFNRGQKGFDHIVGLLANKLVIRLTVGTEITVREFLENSRETLINSMNHQQYPYELLHDAYAAMGHDPKKIPLSQTFFNYLYFPQTYTLKDASLKLHIQEKFKEVLPISLEVTDNGTELYLRALSSAGYFNKEELAQLAKRYMELLDKVITSDNTTISSLLQTPILESTIQTV